MVPRAGLEPARIAPHAPQTCAATNYATSADFQRNYLLAGALGGAEFASVVVAGSAAFAFVSGAVLALAAGAFELVLDGASAGASGFDERTETFPFIAGIEISNAMRKNTTAAPIVSLDKTVAVPRGPNAELEILLVNSAPASVLPGCSRTAATRTTQEIIKIVYKI